MQMTIQYRHNNVDDGNTSKLQVLTKKISTLDWFKLCKGIVGC